jgi:colanic acid/amylovoran biosynthesis glycosyltransferase
LPSKYEMLPKLIHPYQFIRYKGNYTLNKLYCIAAASHFSKVIKKLNLDVLHAHFANEPAFTAMLISRATDIPFTFTGHAFDIFIDPDIGALKERMENASAVITPSYYNRDYLHNLTKVDKNKIHVVRACSNIDKFGKITKVDGSSNILTVGRLVEKKGIKYAIMAIKEIIDDFPEIKYKIVGSGPLEGELRDMVRDLRMEDNITFLGSLNDEGLIKELRNAGIFVLPCIKASNGDMDVCPLTLQEAMIAKVPVVSCNIASIPELIRDGVEGFLVEPRSSRELAGAIKTLKDDADLRTKMGFSGSKKIDNEFNVHKEVELLLNLWNKMNR